MLATTDHAAVLMLTASLLPPMYRAAQEAFASVDVYPDRLELRGHGMVESRTLALEPLSDVS
ncbi:unnamed protein product [Scytosiphon promiscuus]